MPSTHRTTHRLLFTAALSLPALLVAACDDELPTASEAGAEQTRAGSPDLWSRTYGYRVPDISESFQATIPSQDEGFLAIGFRRCAFDSLDLNCHANGQFQEPRLWAVKVNPDGSQIVWEKAYAGFKGTLGIRAIAGEPLGPGPQGETYIIVGIDRLTPPGFSGNPRLKVVKLDYLGNVLQDEVFAPPPGGDEYEQMLPTRIIRGVDDEGDPSGWIVVGFAIVDQPALGPSVPYKNRGFILGLDDGLAPKFFNGVDRGLLVSPSNPLLAPSDERFYSVIAHENRYIAVGLSEVDEVGRATDVAPLLAVYTPDGTLEQAAILDDFVGHSPDCVGLFAADIRVDANDDLRLLLNDHYSLGTLDFAFECPDPSFYLATLSPGDLGTQAIFRYSYDYVATLPPSESRIHAAAELDVLSNGLIAVTTHHNYLGYEYASLLGNDWSDTSVNLIAPDGNVARQLDYGGYATHDTVRDFQELPDGRCLLTGSTDLVSTPSLYTSPKFDPVFGAGLTFSRPQDGWLAMDQCLDSINFTTPNIATGPYPLTPGYSLSLPRGDPWGIFDMPLGVTDGMATTTPIDLPELKIPVNLVEPPSSTSDPMSSPVTTFFP